MIRFILCAFLLTAPVTAFANEQNQIKQIEDYVDHFLQDVSKKWRRDAKKLVPTVVEIANRHGVDPLLVAVITSCESSWRVGVVSKSKYKERGLMQVHGEAAKGFDLSTPEGQIEAGVVRLKKALTSCGSILGALSHYQTSGRCKPIKHAKRRLRLYKKAKEAFGG